MTLHQLTETSQPDLARDCPCVVVAADSINQNLRVCLESTFAHTSTDVPVVVVSATPLGALRHLLGEGTDRQHAVWFAPAVAEPLGESKDALTAAVDRALPMLWPADIALLSEPCRVAPGWLERLRRAARADSNTATASALTDVGTALA